jgi:hypothetical protein
MLGTHARPLKGRTLAIPGRNRGVGESIAVRANRNRSSTTDLGLDFWMEHGDRSAAGQRGGTN